MPLVKHSQNNLGSERSLSVGKWKWTIGLTLLVILPAFVPVVSEGQERATESSSEFRKMLGSDPRFRNIRLLDIVNPNDTLAGTKGQKWYLVGSVPTEKARLALLSLIQESGLQRDIEIDFSVRDAEGSASGSWGKQEVMGFFSAIKSSCEVLSDIKYGMTFFLDAENCIIWRSVSGDLDAKLRKDIALVADREEDGPRVVVSLFSIADQSRLSLQNQADLTDAQAATPRSLVYNVATGTTTQIAFLFIDSENGSTNCFSGTLYGDTAAVRIGIVRSKATGGDSFGKRRHP